VGERWLRLFEGYAPRRIILGDLAHQRSPDSAMRSQRSEASSRAIAA
jgi:hypothetical protein